MPWMHAFRDAYASLTQRTILPIQRMVVTKINFHVLNLFDLNSPTIGYGN